MWGQLAGAFLGGGGGGAAPLSPDQLESSLSAKINPTFANSFAVGGGATATSSPITGDGQSGPIPTEYLIAGGAVLLVVLVLAVRK